MNHFSLDLGFTVLTVRDLPMLFNFAIAIILTAVGFYHMLRRDRDKNE